ncbi:putative nuclease HARBI1 [Tanacetum coccineum]
MGAVGALDGTLIHARVPINKQHLYRGRGKGDCYQNVLAICDFNMMFTFLVAGWEGVAHDSRILSEAIRNQNAPFPLPPPDKYYLCDAAYAHTRGFMAPYRNVRYWLGDFRRRRPLNGKEKFNHSHAKLRNVIERAYGVLKARFPILKRMAPFSLTTQRNITIACFALHNFIRKEGLDDELFSTYDQLNVQLDNENVLVEDDGGVEEDQVVQPQGNASDREYMTNLRDQIAQQLMQSGGDHVGDVQRSTRDLVAFVDETISEHHRNGLEQAGWKIRMIQRIRNPKAKDGKYNTWNYTKFRLWQLTDYVKIIFIDADVLILRNIDFLFQMPEISAIANNGTLFNSGVMVIEPSNCTFRLLMNHINEITSYNGGDQGFLNEIFTWWHRLPKHVNFLKFFWIGDNEKAKEQKTNLFGANPPIIYALHQGRPVDFGGPVP